MPIPFANYSNQSAQESLESYSLIIAEDDRTMAKLLVANLHRLGHKVTGIAWNGKEAVAMALKTRPDAVIMDLHMPLVDGLQAAREIHQVQLIPIILSTGMADARTIRRVGDLQAVSYLLKPFSPDQLKVAVHLAVAQGRALAGAPAVRAA